MTESEELVFRKTVETLLTDETDYIKLVLFATLMSFTKSLWNVSGEGSGGVTRAFGEDFLNLMKIGSEMLGDDMDMSNPQKAMEFYDNHLIRHIGIADSMDFNVTDDTLEIEIKNCKLHQYTDYLENSNVPRSIGCPLALISIAVMEKATGKSFIVDKIESKEGNSNIIIKAL